MALTVPEEVSGSANEEFALIATMHYEEVLY